MIDVWLGMIDAKLYAYMYASVCVSIDAIFSVPNRGKT